MATSYQRGHPIKYTGKEWVYADDGSPAIVERPCVRCGRPPTPEGHDACLGDLPGVDAACCGHGVEKGYVKQMTIGQKIAFYRGSLGISQRELAKKSGLTSPAVCQYESGKRVPDLKSFVSICKAFGVTTDTLLKGVDI